MTRQATTSPPERLSPTDPVHSPTPPYDSFDSVHSPTPPYDSFDSVHKPTPPYDSFDSVHKPGARPGATIPSPTDPAHGSTPANTAANPTRRPSETGRDWDLVARGERKAARG